MRDRSCAEALFTYTLRPEFTSTHLTLPTRSLLVRLSKRERPEGPLVSHVSNWHARYTDRVRSDVELLLSGQLASGMPVAVARTSPMSLERFAVAAGAIERVPPKVMHQLLDAVTDPLYENRTKPNKGLRFVGVKSRSEHSYSL